MDGFQSEQHRRYWWQHRTGQSVGTSALVGTEVDVVGTGEILDGLGLYTGLLS